MRRLCNTIIGVGLGLCGACADDVAGATGQGGDGGGTGAASSTSTSTVGPTPGVSTEVDTTSAAADTTAGGTTGADCEAEGTCTMIDLLIVIDGSSTMVQEQANVAANLGRVVERIQGLTDAGGDRLEPSVNIMVTTTDNGSCTPRLQMQWSAGAPVVSGCNARIEDFTGPGGEDVQEACTQLCPQDVVPTQHFIHFDATGTNVPGDDVVGALRCIGPQGIRGCEYEAPLEAMYGALHPEACWNDPTQPRCTSDPAWASVTEGFLRDDAKLVVMIIADEPDCSVPPRNFAHFIDDDTHWALNPQTMQPEPSSALCHSAGTQCEDGDGDGIYESCVPNDAAGVLHPVEDYVSFLRQIREEQGKDVLMLGVLGVPPVTEHNAEHPFEPIAGGVFDLVYRDWTEDDLLPGETIEGQRFAFGPLGPGCSGDPSSELLTGHAQPPTRIREVCERLDFTDEEGNERIACCIESICDEDFSAAIDCLHPPGRGFLPPKG